MQIQYPLSAHVEYARRPTMLGVLRHLSYRALTAGDTWQHVHITLTSDGDYYGIVVVDDVGADSGDLEVADEELNQRANQDAAKARERERLRVEANAALAERLRGQQK